MLAIIVMYRCADPSVSAELFTRVRALILMLLTKLDEASDHIEKLNCAFKTEDVYGALSAQEGLQRAWSEAFVAIRILEQVSGRSQIHARTALRQSHRRARVPLVLAWNIISRLPNEHHSEMGHSRCRAPS